VTLFLDSYELVKEVMVARCGTVGRSDTNEGQMLKESHTYEKHPT
jgi:hypothetical protein